MIIILIVLSKKYIDGTKEIYIQIAKSVERDFGQSMLPIFGRKATNSIQSNI